MARAAWWISVLILCCGWLPAHAALTVADAGINLRSSGELTFQFDQSDSLTLDDLRRGAGEWHPVDGDVRVPRATTAPVWLHFTIAAPDRDRALILLNPIAKQMVLDVYLIENDRVVARYETGSSRPFASRPLPYRGFLFPIVLHANTPIDVFVRVRGYPSRTVEFLQLWPEQKLLTELPAQDAFAWVAIGVMLVTTLAAIVVWLFVRQFIFGLFAAFVAMQLIGYTVTRGYVTEWLWPNSPAIDLAADPIAVSLSLIVNIGFSITFLNLREQLPRLYRVAQAGLIILAIVGLMSPFQPIIAERMGVFSLLLFYPFLLSVSFYLWRRGTNRTDAGIFLLCSGAYIVLLLMVSTTSLLGSYSWWYSAHLIDIGQLQRILFFAGCLGYRFRETVRSEERARADAHAKSEFLARMSHEIRTPMNGILGMSELLRDAGLNSLQRRYNDIVYSSATALLTIINDILDFSKIQAGRMEVEKVPFDLHRLAVDVLTLFRVKAEEKNLELLLDIRPDVAAWVMGDPTRIRQILVNLLSNAIKFTEGGEIRLRLSKNGDVIRLAVKDTGIGITADAQSRLFESFMQADASVARNHGGTGLGLAISLQLAELMGGKIDVLSHAGRGSTFWVDLPLPPTARQELLPPLLALQGKKVLVVDDNKHFCELIAESVKSWGMQLHVAYSGEDALLRVRELRAKNTHFDLISIDLKMPAMNGLELAHALKAECGAALPRLLLLTAATDMPNSAMLREANIVLAQEKPLLMIDLREAFARALGLVMLPTADILPQRLHVSPRKALIVLVVEDNLTNQIVVQSMLQKLGHACLLTAGGEEAVALYKRRHGEIDVVLMDCDMPDVDGYTATRAIRQFEQEYLLPHKTIVALTAHTLPEQVMRCHDAGMDHHLAKPIGIDRLDEFLALVGDKTAH